MAASQRNHDQNSDPQPCKTCWSRLIPVIMFETLKGRLTAVLSLLLLFPLCHINLPAARLCKTSYVSGSTFGSTFKHRPAAFCHTVSICSRQASCTFEFGGCSRCSGENVQSISICPEILAMLRCISISYWLSKASSNCWGCPTGWLKAWRSQTAAVHTPHSTS
jgi:hypothetical protein